MKELIERLRLGAAISRGRNLNLDFADIADDASDALERLNNELIAHEVTVDNLTAERDAKGESYDLLAHEIDQLTAEVASLKLLDSQRLESLRAIEIERDALKQIKDEAWEAAKGVRQRLEDEREALRADAELWRWVSPRLECRKEVAMSGAVKEAIGVRPGRSFVDTKPRPSDLDAELLKRLITAIKEANHD